MSGNTILKNIMNKFHNFSVSWKFIVAYFAILIVPIIFLGIFIYHQAVSSATEQAQIVLDPVSDNITMEQGFSRCLENS